jgi:hypothetical protein
MFKFRADLPTGTGTAAAALPFITALAREAAAQLDPAVTRVTRAPGDPQAHAPAGLARLLTERAHSFDSRFASGSVPWPAASQILLPDLPGER